MDTCICTLLYSWACICARKSSSGKPGPRGLGLSLTDSPPCQQYTVMQSISAPSATRRSRSAKACENCRDRRTKCEPPYPCRACKAAGLKDCQVRERARPSRYVQVGPYQAYLQTDPHRRFFCYHTCDRSRGKSDLYFAGRVGTRTGLFRLDR